MPAPTTQFFTGQMPFLPPNEQHQSTEGTHQLTQPFHSEVYNSPNGTLSSKNFLFPPLVSLSEEHKL